MLIALVSVGLLGQSKHPRKAARQQHRRLRGCRKKSKRKLYHKDSNGKIRAELSMVGHRADIQAARRERNPVDHAFLNDGSPQGPMMLFSDPQHHAGVSLSVLEGMGSSYRW